MNLGIVVVAGATAVSPAAAQTSSGGSQPATGAKPARKPVQNLQDEAKRPRDGEVVPGSASPETPAPAAPAATRPETPDPAPAPAPAPAAAEKPAAAPAAKPATSTGDAKKSNPSPAEAKPAEGPAKPKVRESTAATSTPPSAPRPNGTRPMQSPREFIAAGHQFVAYDVIAFTVEAVIFLGFLAVDGSVRRHQLHFFFQHPTVTLFIGWIKGYTVKIFALFVLFVFFIHDDVHRLADAVFLDAFTLVVDDICLIGIDDSLRDLCPLRKHQRIEKKHKEKCYLSQRARQKCHATRRRRQSYSCHSNDSPGLRLWDTITSLMNSAL